MCEFSRPRADLQQELCTRLHFRRVFTSALIRVDGTEAAVSQGDSRIFRLCIVSLSDMQPVHDR